MITRYTFGNPVETYAVPQKPEACGKLLPFFERSEDGLTYSMKLNKDEIVYGLGEQIRGINKRGWTYTSFCADNPHHEEGTHSLYGAHNFLVFDREKPFGVFFDHPGEMTFDIGYSDLDTIKITARYPDTDIYIIDGETPYGIVRAFRKLIGQSYIPPLFGFGFQQSRWGYRCKEDVDRVLEAYSAYGLPLDSVCLDIDYMEDYKDFTVNSGRFPDFEDYVASLKKENIHLIPIIDAGVKIEEGYDVYEEGRENGYFCKKQDGSDFVAGVWPGRTHFPDFLNPDVRKWFGEKYYRLTEAGIEGFWNDMNEPAMFYSDEGLEKAKQQIQAVFSKEIDIEGFFALGGLMNSISNSPADYASFYHEFDGIRARHDTVHNLFGYNMTKAAAEAFAAKYPDRRLLLYSRASYIGAHRYGGIWTGDNMSWWSHLLLNIKMMPSLNMCGFLYSGADLGGFGADTSGDLLLRWLQFGIFTPLMRDHSAIGTLLQEPYRFGNIDAFRRTLQLRYRLMGYIYSEFMKAALEDECLFRPLAFDYPEDTFAKRVEDQLMFGESLMLAPVYEQNARGRYVYLPEDMLFVKFISLEEAENERFVEYLEDGTPYIAKPMPAGHHYIDVALDETHLFVRPGKLLPLLRPANTTAELDFTAPEVIAYPHGQKELAYRYYTDDGVTKDYTEASHFKNIVFTVK
jgi:alpha-glucosidase